jgi:hypothetical protein
MNRAGILTVDLFAPVLVIRDPHLVALFVHCFRLLPEKVTPNPKRSRGSQL